MKFDFNKNWTLSMDGFEPVQADVPCSVYGVLLASGQIPDPFYRCNEKQLTSLCDRDCVFSKTFVADEEMLSGEKLLLEFDGIDTLADVSLNGRLLGRVENMHIGYCFDVTGLVRPGENDLTVEIDSPNRYVSRKQDEYPLWCVKDAVEGYPHLRKAHCMFGWDWGPKLPDMGLFREVRLVSVKGGRMEQMKVSQSHGPDSVTLTVESEVALTGEGDYTLLVSAVSPKGERVEVRVPVGREAVLYIEHPLLWWPNGLGEQNLYRIQAVLEGPEGPADEKSLRVGLRTLKVSTARDQWGNEFCFVVNGRKVFSMGADYIPEDNILSRVTPETTRALMEDCKRSNFNTLRVWGGGYYPDDFFYDLCDEYGMIVWQDFMFACATYLLTDEFEQSLTEEFIYNLKRIRHHACLGLLCGNNEMELGWVEWNLPADERLRQDYITLYERLLPRVCKKYAPDTFYWPASPSSGGGFLEPSDPNKGDVHFWEVWHGSRSFEVYRDYYFRFCSEFGFESLPDPKTLQAVALPEDMNLFSPVLEHHQKCVGGNKKILAYLADNYRYPECFDTLVYTSQLMQADAIRYGVEHWRRYRGRCMGAVYWQLNDCWPVVSWASRDYYGRWKALQYSARRFFAPVLLSAHAKGTQVTLNVSNETLKTFRGTVTAAVRDNAFGEYFRAEYSVEVGELSSLDAASFDAAPYLDGKETSRYLCYELRDEAGALLLRQSLIFVKPKAYEYKNPEISVRAEERDGSFLLHVSARRFAAGVAISFGELDAVLSDNFFDLTGPEEVTVTLDKVWNCENLSADTLIRSMKVLSTYNVGR